MYININGNISLLIIYEMIEIIFSYFVMYWLCVYYEIGVVLGVEYVRKVSSKRWGSNVESKRKLV